MPGRHLYINRELNALFLFIVLHSLINMLPKIILILHLTFWYFMECLENLLDIILNILYFSKDC